MKKKIQVIDIALPILSAALLIGSLTFFAPCGAKEDGSWMHCHRAGQAVSGVALCMLALAVIRLLCGTRVKIALDAALTALCILAALIPGQLVDLCMMPEMRCRRLLAPFAVALAILTAIFAVIDIFGKRKRKHEL